jgi:fibronectin-binding autotransporter adhesin
MFASRLVGILCLLVLPVTSRAQTWNGASSTSNNWSAGGATGNWTGAAAPVNNGTANVHFGGTTRITANQDAAWNVNSVIFDAGGGNFVLGGQPLTIGAGGAANNNTGQAEGISNALVLSANQAWGGSGPIFCTGPTINLQSSALVVNGTDHVSFTNTISGSASTAFTVNSGALDLDGASNNTYTGNTQINNGTLILGKTGGAIAVGGPLTIGNAFGNPFSAYVQYLANGQTSATTDVLISNDGILDVHSVFTNIRTLIMFGGTVGIGTGQLTLNGDVTVFASSNGSGSIITAADSNNDLILGSPTRTFTVADGSAQYDLDLSGCGITGGTLVKAGPGTMRLNAGNNSALAVTLNAGTLAVGSTNSLGAGTLTLAGGSLQADGAALQFANPVSLTGTCTISGSAAGPQPLQFAGLITVSGSQQLIVSSPAGATFAGGINATGGTLTLVTSPGALFPDMSGGIVSGSVNVAGTLFLDGATVTATMTNQAQSQLIQNAGSFTGTLINSAGATFTYSGGSFTGSLDNSGVVNFSKNFSAGSITNRSAITVNPGLTLSASIVDNEGTVVLNGGTLTAAGSLTNNNKLTGSGTIANVEDFINAGQITPSGGNINVGYLSFGSFTNSGSIILSPGNGMFLTAGPSMINTGSIQLGGGTLSGTTAADNKGSIIGPGLISAPLTNDFGGILLNSSPGSLNVSTAFTNSGMIQLGSPGSIISGGAISNSGSIAGLGSVGNNVTNNGTIESSGGTLSVNGTLSNSASGTIAVDAASKIFVGQGLATNAGVISMTGGTFDNNSVAMNNTGQISGFGIFRSGGLTNNGTVILTGGLTTVNGAVTNVASKVFTVQYNPAIFTGLVTNNGTFNVISTTAPFAGGSSGTPGLFTPGGLVTGGLEGTGSINVTAGGMLQASYIRQNSASIAGNIPLRPSSQGGDVSILNSLSITGAGKLDLNDNDLIVNYTSSSPAATIRAYLISGFNAGNWNGVGLSSSAAHTDGTFATALGYADVSSTTFDGQSIAHAVIVKYTYYGDSNLDGSVTTADFQTFLDGFASGAGTWQQGDFTYDGKVDLGNDFNLFLIGYLARGGALGDLAPIISNDSALSVSQKSQLLSAVPEPSSVLVLMAPLIAGLWRRKNGAGRSE